MRQSWKLVWSVLSSLAIVCAIGIGFYAYMFWPHCDREEIVLATDASGRSVVSYFEACTSIGTTTEQSIELKSASGARKTIFKYDAGYGVVGCEGKTFPESRKPSVDWSNPGVIHISIDVVYDIYQKRDDVDGTQVTYSIGKVISQDCDFAKTST